MKKYFIYEKKIEKEFIEGSDDFYFKEHEFECIGYLEGVQKVYDYCYYKTIVESFNFHIPQQYKYRTFKMWLKPCPYIPSSYYLITDEFGRVRNFKELTYNANKGRTTKKNRQARQYVSDGSNINEKRQSITPFETNEAKKDFGIYLKQIKSKRNFADMWLTEGYTKVSKSWKDQSKRKCQYKRIKEQ